ncbi:hypothetical protein CMI37_38465 [Candidatus Pacearchaeota archaeon]|nr:hypothetical protein [Candidatus Pacearchaeota archaeon]
MAMPSRAINIFINDKINTKAIDLNIFQKIINLFDKEGFDFRVDTKLRMIRINNLDRKRKR